MAYLVLIETSGNQHYIFATNRLRENAGASEIIFQAGTGLVVDAIGQIVKGSGRNNPLIPYENLAEGASKRVDQLVKIGEQQNPLGTCGVEIIVSTSGKALLLVDEKKTGEDIIWQVTRRVLEKFPGLAMLGIVGKEFDAENGSVDDAHKAVMAIHKEIEKLKSRLPSPLARFPTIPFVHPCDSSGLPAQEHRKSESDPADNGAFSKVTLKKRDDRPDAHKRIGDDTGVKNLANSPKVLDRLRREGKLEWVAIVHADGNGFGGLFLKFGKKAKEAGCRTARQYFNLLRRFSCSLELCGLSAFKAAIEDAGIKSLKVKLRNGKTEELLPIVPLILGGDDLTVVMDGRQALKFIAAYQRAFEKQTVALAHQGFPNAIKKVTGGKVLGSGAGVAIVKPHYPFHRAYDLAENLIKSAKKSKSILGTSAISALDFHILFDNGATSLEELRENLGYDRETGPKERLSLRPYVVSDDAALKKAGKLDDPWIVPRKWDDLDQCAVTLANASKSEENPIPNSQLHMLRDALHEGRQMAEARYDLIKHRYRDLGRELYIDNVNGEEGPKATWLLDAMELINIEQRYQEGKS